MIVPFGGIGEGTSDGEQGQGGRAGGGGQGEAGEAVDVRDRQRPGARQILCFVMYFIASFPSVLPFGSY